MLRKLIVDLLPLVFPQQLHNQFWILHEIVLLLMFHFPFVVSKWRQYFRRKWRNLCKLNSIRKQFLKNIICALLSAPHTHRYITFHCLLQNNYINLNKNMSEFPTASCYSVSLLSLIAFSSFHCLCLTLIYF